MGQQPNLHTAVNLRNLLHAAAGALGVAFMATAQLAAQISAPLDPVATGLAGSTQGRDDDLLFVRDNPAALRDGRWDGFAFIHPSLVSTADIDEGSLAVAFPSVGIWQTALLLDGVAAPGYRQLLGRAVLRVRLRDDVTAAMAPGFATVVIEDYQTHIVPTLDAGMLVEINRELRLGASVANAGGASLAGRRLPQRIGIGILTQVEPGIAMSLDATHNTGRSITLATAASIRLSQYVTVRTGVSSQPMVIGLGIGVRHDNVRFEYGARWLPTLGLQQAVGIGIR